ncbi:PH domain-containing protein [Fodinicola acaciae]|uniref:PH domain-containing protein n=1 Tax=Fodinicola acaciae TaxID=2681555 RepID=UPI0013D09113|nr:PH domain-containing protein [Fodinicola acaciae]
MARNPDVVKFRQPVAVPIACLILLVGSAAVAGQTWWTAPLMLIPLALFVYALRTGVDVSPDWIRVRSAVTNRSLPWSQVAGFDAEGRRVAAKLTDGNVVRLPAVQPGDLARLLRAGRQDVAENDDGNATTS